MSIKTMQVNGTTSDIEVIEERFGEIEDDNGYVIRTYNCYAGIGYEIDEDGNRTGRQIAWAGNNAEGVIEVIENTDLDAYLNNWDGEWVEQFDKEGLL